VGLPSADHEWGVQGTACDLIAEDRILTIGSNQGNICFKVGQHRFGIAAIPWAKIRHAVAIDINAAIGIRNPVEAHKVIVSGFSTEGELYAGHAGQIGQIEQGLMFCRLRSESAGPHRCSRNRPRQASLRIASDRLRI
jgi:hypothetical protein